MSTYRYWELDDNVGRSFYRSDDSGKAWMYDSETKEWWTDARMTLRELQVFAALPGVKVWQQVSENAIQ